MSETRALDLGRASAGGARRARREIGARLRGLLYGSALYRASLRGRAPDHLARRPVEPWSGDAERGRRLLAGQYRFAGEAASAGDGPPWRPAGAGEAWLAAMHGFGWLRDLAAVETGEAQAAMRAAVESWIERCGRWEALVWRADVIGRRLAAWIGQADRLLDGAEPAFRRAFLASLAAQTRHLARVAATDVDGEARIAALSGLVIAGLALPGEARRAAQGLRQLELELDRQILADGGHFERSPAAHFEVFRALVALRAALAHARVATPGPLQRAIDRAAPMLRFYRHGDGGLALFNGSTEGDAAEIDATLARGEAEGRPPASAPHVGFERLAAGPALAIVDVGGPPPIASLRAHAGPLAFEFSVGRERLVVNCGVHAADHPAWRKAQRATAAHSTATIDDTNAFRIEADGGLSREAARVTCARHEDEGNIWIDAQHDGYRTLFGLTHRRRMYLAADGTDLRGEDVFRGPGGRAFAIRFHLHPEVKASLVGDGSGALLRLRRGGGWRLRAAGAAMQLAESVYLGEGGQVRRSEQVVLSGALKDSTTTVKWAFSRIDQRG